MPIVVVTPFLGEGGWWGWLPCYVLFLPQQFEVAYPTFITITILDRMSRPSLIFYNLFSQAHMRASICSFIKKCGTHVDETRRIWKWSFRIRLRLILGMFTCSARFRSMMCRFSRMITLTVFTFNSEQEIFGRLLCGVSSAEMCPLWNSLCHHLIWRLEWQFSL